MRNPAITLAFLAMLAQSTASAANDWSRNYGDLSSTSRGGQIVRGTGVGVQIGVTIRLGPQREVRNSERVQLNVSAGPAQTFISTNNMRAQTSIAPLARFTVKPGYSADASLGNFRLVSHRTVLGAAEDAAQDEAGESKKDDGGGPSTLGWVAIGLSGLAITLLAANAACVETNCLGSE